MFNFPNTPSLGDAYRPVGGPMYEWDGEKWMMTGSALIQTPAYDQRNRIVNGAMTITQENPTGTPLTTTLSYVADQWRVGIVVAAGAPYAAHRDIGVIWPTDPDASCWLRLHSGTTVANASPGASDSLNLLQFLEGRRMIDLKWGSAQAKPIVVRFKATATVAGTFCFSFRNNGNARSYVQSFTVTPNVPQWFTFKVPGDTSGTWPTDNTLWGSFTFSGLAGSGVKAPSEATWQAGNFVGAPSMSNLMSAINQMLDVSCVGLYLDPNNTGLPPAWEMPDEASELLACQRYYQRLDTLWSGNVTSAAVYFMKNTYPIPMRATPAVASISSGASGFPTASGLFSPGPFAVQENRTANASANGSYFSSFIACNSRM